MKITVFHIFTKRGYSRTAKKLPRLTLREIAIRQTYDIPDDVFRSQIFSEEVAVSRESIIHAKPRLIILDPPLIDEELQAVFDTAVASGDIIDNGDGSFTLNPLTKAHIVATLEEHGYGEEKLRGMDIGDFVNACKDSGLW